VERAVRDIRDEAAARGALAQRILGADRVSVPAGSLHAWLRLPPSWTIAAFVAQAQQQRVRVAPADWYVLPTDAKHALPIPTAVRLTLGAEPDRAQLERALRTLAAILEQPVGLRTANL
jgi:DNA-binding transcriptional MocR family regulator